jgi:hypothetical protein
MVMATTFWVGTATIDLTQSDMENFHNWCADATFVDLIPVGIMDIAALQIRFVARQPLPAGVFVVPDNKGVPQVEYSATIKGKQR